MQGLVLEQLTKSYRPEGKARPALDRLDLQLQPGEFLVILGPSGSGKTTCLRLIAGLEKPDSGQIWLNGASLNGLKAADRDMAMVFQQSSLFPHLTVRENLGLGLKLRKTPGALIDEKVGAVVSTLGLASHLDRLPEFLSGGEQQRVALGRALVREPKLFLYDEPLSQLDLPTRIELRREIRALHRKNGVGALYVTHDQAEAMALGDRIAVLNGGSLMQIGTPQELYRKPANLFVAGFLGSPPMNFIEGTVETKNNQARFYSKHLQERSIDFPCPFPPGKGVTLGIRPENLSLGGENRGEVSDLRGEITHVEWLGAETLLTCSIEQRTIVVRQASSAGLMQPGAPVSVQINRDELHWFETESGRRISGC